MLCSWGRDKQVTVLLMSVSSCFLGMSVTLQNQPPWLLHSGSFTDSVNAWPWMLGEGTGAIRYCWPSSAGNFVLWIILYRHPWTMWTVWTVPLISARWMLDSSLWTVILFDFVHISCPSILGALEIKNTINAKRHAPGAEGRLSTLFCLQNVFDELCL